MRRLLIVAALIALATPAWAQQYVRPTSDIATGTWNTTPCWSKLDDSTSGTGGDGDYCGPTTNPANDLLNMGASSVTDPAVSTGHILKIRHRRLSGARTCSMIVRLYEGVTERANFTSTSTSSAFAEDTYTLSAAEANSITSYSTLSLRIEANTTGGGSPTTCQTSAVELEVPAATGGGGRTRRMF